MSEYEKSLLLAIMNYWIVRDELGEAWYFGHGAIRLASAEWEIPTEIADNGYGCLNFESGVELLREYGYIK